MVGRVDEIGSPESVVRLQLGDDDVLTAKRYDVKSSVFSQPATFALTCGWGKTAAELLEKYPPRTKFQIKVGRDPEVIIQTGLLDDRTVSGAVTDVVFGGRDMMAALHDTSFTADSSFSEKTYWELTSKMLEKAYIDIPTLYSDNTANRKAITGGAWQQTQSDVELDGKLLKIEQVAEGTGKRRFVYNTIKASIQERYYDFLAKQYKKAGLFLWCTGSGDFVLGRPNADQAPLYRLSRKRGNTRAETNVIRCRYVNNTRDRFGQVAVYGRGGGGKAGRKQVYGLATDDEMIGWGYGDKIQIVHDRDCKTAKEARYAALLEQSRQARAGWKLQYTVSGHRTQSLVNPNRFATWAVDTTVEVEDEEIGIHGVFYISEVSFQRDPATTTTLTLNRARDLVFAAEGDE